MNGPLQDIRATLSTEPDPHWSNWPAWKAFCTYHGGVFRHLVSPKGKKVPNHLGPIFLYGKICQVLTFSFKWNNVVLLIDGDVRLESFVKNQFSSCLLLGFNLWMDVTFHMCSTIQHTTARIPTTNYNTLLESHVAPARLPFSKRKHQVLELFTSLFFRGFVI